MDMTPAWDYEQSMCNAGEGKKAKQDKKIKERGDDSQTPSLGHVSSGMCCVSQLLFKTLY